MPACRVKMQELIGKSFVKLEKRDGMEGFHVKQDSEGVVLSEGMVCGFVSWNGDARASGALVEVADGKHMVQVMFGAVPIMEKRENAAESSSSLAEVSTPVTPRSDASI